MRDAFHHVTVARDEISVVVDDRIIRPIEKRAEQRFTYRHADRISDTLSEWTRRRFDSRRVTVFRMTGSFALPLTELLDVVECQLISREIENTVDEHRCMAGRENESIAIEPVGITR